MYDNVDDNGQGFNSFPIVLTTHQNNCKTLNIPIKKRTNILSNVVSKSWEKSNNNFMYLDQPVATSVDALDIEHNQWRYNPNYLTYDAIHNCKSAGIIPYTIYNNKLYFLFQKINEPERKKDHGWNDFGGKQLFPNETTAETAAREFSEETSCLFYLRSHPSEESSKNYQLLKNNRDLNYDQNTIDILRQLIPISQTYYAQKITEFISPIYASSKETYITYFVKVDYISENDLPSAEDIHIPYEYRYLRTCHWFSIDDLLIMDNKLFHKRLQITRILQRIKSYYDKALFS